VCADGCTVMPPGTDDACASGGQPPPPPPPSEPTCGQLAAQKGWSNALCEWNGNHACDGQGPATSDCDHCCDASAPPPPPPPPTCGCHAGYDNCCDYPPGTRGCDMTAPHGYCDPNGDASYTDGDWYGGTTSTTSSAPEARVEVRWPDEALASLLGLGNDGGG